MKTLRPYHQRSALDQEYIRRRVVASLSKGACVAHLARRYGVSRQTIYTWRAAAAADPARGLAARPRGTACALSADQLERLRQMLLEGPLKHGFLNDLWTIERVRQLVRKEFGVAYAKRSLWHVLQVRLDFSPQKPERLAREGDPDEIARWKRRFARWKKKGAG